MAEGEGERRYDDADDEERVLNRVVGLDAFRSFGVWWFWGCGL